MARWGHWWCWARASAAVVGVGRRLCRTSSPCCHCLCLARCPGTHRVTQALFAVSVVEKPRSVARRVQHLAGPVLAGTAAPGTCSSSRLSCSESRNWHAPRAAPCLRLPEPVHSVGGRRDALLGSQDKNVVRFMFDVYEVGGETSWCCVPVS